MCYVLPIILFITPYHTPSLSIFIKYPGDLEIFLLWKSYGAGSLNSTMFQNFFVISYHVISNWPMKNEISINFFMYHFKTIIIQAGIMINCRNAGLNYHKFQSIIYVLNSGPSYENYPILNAYNFLYRTYFENLTGNLIELISKNKITSLFFWNFIFLKS